MKTAVRSARKLRYSLAVIALELQRAFGVDSIDDLPISFDIAW
jgi:hydroxylamine reductase